MSAVAIQQMADRVGQLLEERLGIGGKDLAARLRKGGRVLPKRIRESAQLLADAAEKAKNPKLVAQVDMAAVSTAYDACLKHLTAIDPADHKRSVLSGMLGFIGGGIFLLAIAIIAVLVWRGFL